MTTPVVRAMILAAGLGTRLKPFTDAHPKALFVVNGKTLLEHSLGHLKQHGITSVVINVHHFAAQVLDFLQKNNNFGMDIAISDETDQLLETGGGLKKASWFFTGCDHIVARNVDIISDLDLDAMITTHRDQESLATLAVRDRKTERYFLLDDGMQLKGWMNNRTGELKGTGSSKGLNPFAFSGIQVLNSSVFQLITEEGRFSLTDLYLRLATTHKISGYIDRGRIWKDVGTAR